MWCSERSGERTPVFWLVPPDSTAQSVEIAYADFTRPACQAIRTQGVKRIVSALGRGSPRSTGYVSASLAMDDLIMTMGVDCRVLTMPSFMSLRCSRPQVTTCSTASKTLSQDVRKASALSFHDSRRAQRARKSM